MSNMREMMPLTDGVQCPACDGLGGVTKDPAAMLVAVMGHFLDSYIAQRAVPAAPALLTTKAAAHRLGRNQKTVERWIRRGILRGHKSGSRLFVKSDVLDAFIAAMPSGVRRRRPRAA